VTPVVLAALIGGSSGAFVSPALTAQVAFAASAHSASHSTQGGTLVVDNATGAQ